MKRSQRWSRRSLLNVLQNRELGVCRLRGLRNYPESFLAIRGRKRGGASNGSPNGSYRNDTGGNDHRLSDMLELQRRLEKLLVTHPMLADNTEFGECHQIVVELADQLGINTGGSMEIASLARDAFVSLGGPVLLAKLLHSPVLVPTYEELAVETNSEKKFEASTGATTKGQKYGSGTASINSSDDEEEVSSVRVSKRVVAAGVVAAGVATAGVTIAGVAAGVAAAGVVAALDNSRVARRQNNDDTESGNPSGKTKKNSNSYKITPAQANATNMETANIVLSTLLELSLHSSSDDGGNSTNSNPSPPAPGSAGSAAAASLSQSRTLLPVLFELMQTSLLVDGAVSLAQELLAAGPDLFVLEEVTHLARLVPALPPRALALFCRTIAALFSKPEPPSSSPLPPPECVPPNLCAACANRGLLVDIPGLLPRIVQLLRAQGPPRRLWPAQHLYSPNGPIRYSEIPDDTWTSLRQPPTQASNGSLGLREGLGLGAEGLNLLGSDGDNENNRLGRANGRLRNANDRYARQYRQVMVVLPEDQLPPGLEGTPMNIGNAHAGFDNNLRIVRLEAFEKELWTTLQADLLFVIGTLLSNKAREKTQAVLIESGFVEMLDELFRQLKWELPGVSTNSPRASHNRRRYQRRIARMLRRRQRYVDLQNSVLITGEYDSPVAGAAVESDNGVGGEEPPSRDTGQSAYVNGGGGVSGGGGGGGGGVVGALLGKAVAMVDRLRSSNTVNNSGGKPLAEAVVDSGDNNDGSDENADDEEEESEPESEVEEEALLPVGIPEHGAGCSCCPQSCLQMSLLRTIAAFSEKTGGDAMHHRLLLTQPERLSIASAARSFHIRPVRDITGTPIQDIEHAMSEGADMDSTENGIRMGNKEEENNEELEGGGGGGGGGGDDDDDTDDEQEDDDDDEETRVEQAAAAARELATAAEKEEVAKAEADARKTRDRADAHLFTGVTRRALDYVAVDMPTSLLNRLVDTLMLQSPKSSYYFEIASSLHKWLQGARPIEQGLVLTRPGFLKWVLRQLLLRISDKTTGTASTPVEGLESAAPLSNSSGGGVASAEVAADRESGAAPSNGGSGETSTGSRQNAQSDDETVLQQETQQVLFDLLGELIKFNEPALASLEDALLSIGGAQAFVAMNSQGKSSLSGESVDPLFCYHAFARLGRLVLSNIVNAAVFVQCMELTLGYTPKPLRPRLIIDVPDNPLRSTLRELGGLEEKEGSGHGAEEEVNSGLLLGLPAAVQQLANAAMVDGRMSVNEPTDDADDKPLRTLRTVSPHDVDALVRATYLSASSSATHASSSSLSNSKNKDGYESLSAGKMKKLLVEKGFGDEASRCIEKSELLAMLRRADGTSSSDVPSQSTTPSLCVVQGAIASLFGGSFAFRSQVESLFGGIDLQDLEAAAAFRDGAARVRDQEELWNPSQYSKDLDELANCKIDEELGSLAAATRISERAAAVAAAVAAAKLREWSANQSRLRDASIIRAFWTALRPAVAVILFRTISATPAPLSSLPGENKVNPTVSEQSDSAAGIEAPSASSSPAPPPSLSSSPSHGKKSSSAMNNPGRHAYDLCVINATILLCSEGMYRHRSLDTNKVDEFMSFEDLPIIIEALKSDVEAQKKNKRMKGALQSNENAVNLGTCSREDTVVDEKEGATCKDVKMSAKGKQDDGGTGALTGALSSASPCNPWEALPPATSGKPTYGEGIGKGDMGADKKAIDIPGSAGNGKPGSRGPARAVEFSVGLKRALQHWRKYYEHQLYERRFVECQSGLPFSQWEYMVTRMCRVLPTFLSETESDAAADKE